MSSLSSILSTGETSPGTQQYREDDGNSGITKWKGPTGNVTRWTASVDSVAVSLGGTEVQNSVQSTVSLSDTACIFGSLDGSVRSFSRIDGSAIWKFTTQGAIYSSASIFEGKVFITSMDASVYCLEGDTGALLWKSSDSDNDGPIFASPVIAPAGTASPSNPVVLIASGKSIRALIAAGVTSNITSSTAPILAGQRLWLSLLTDSGAFQLTSTPALNIKLGRLFVGTGQNKKVASFDLRTGALVWAYSVNSPVLSSPCLQLYHHGAGLAPTPRVYVAAGNGVYALGQGKGKLLWHVAGNGGYSSVATSNDSTLVFFGSTDSSIYALSAIDGAEQWAYKTGGPIRMSSPVVSGTQGLFVGSTDGFVYSLNISNGDQLWKYNTGAPVSASPAISSDGALFIGNTAGMMFSIGPQVSGVQAPSINPVISPQQPTFPTPAPPNPSSPANAKGSFAASGGGLSAGEIAAAVIFSLIGVALLVFAVFWYVRKSRAASSDRERSSTAAALQVARQQQQQQLQRL